MVKIIEMNLDTNEITYEDHSKVNFNNFYDTYQSYWTNKIAGETIRPFDIERFMKRSSSKNLKQLVDAKKAEGFLEATIGKKMDPGMLKMVLILVVIGIVACVVVLVLKGMHIL